MAGACIIDSDHPSVPRRPVQLASFLPPVSLVPHIQEPTSRTGHSCTLQASGAMLVMATLKWIIISETPRVVVSSTWARLSVIFHLLRLVKGDKARCIILHVCIWVNITTNLVTTILVLVVNSGLFPSDITSFAIEPTANTPISITRPTCSKCCL